MKTNLKTCGIIVEYNPLHNGHIYHIEKTKEISQCDVLIAVMSPNFVQRGEPAIIDKFTRTKYALENGVDIVIELPTHLTLQSAEVFAKSSLKLLSLAKVDMIVYGAESLEKPELAEIDYDLLNEGFSYAYAKNTNKKKPNQILGAYYEKYAKLYNIKTKRILRTNEYKSLEIKHDFSSASAIRHAYRNNEAYLNTSPIDLSKYENYFIEDYFPFIRYQIINNKNILKNYLLVDEGIENLFYNLAIKYETYEDFLKNATSKRYTESRIRRTLMHIYLQTKRDIEDFNSFRVLGMSHVGQKYLASIKKEATFVTSIKNYEYKELELKATRLYAINKKSKNIIKQELGPVITI